jgi:hypothetical protein
MNIIKNKLKIFAFVTLFFVGCKQIDEVVDISPTMLLGEETSLANLSDAERLLFSTYGRMRSVHLTSTYLSDFLADDLKIGYNGTGQGVSLYEYTQMNSATPEVSTIWINAYGAINLANIIIQKVPQLDAIDQNQQFLKTRILAEAYAIRAMVHFDLLKYYAEFYDGTNGGKLGVPYIKEPAFTLQTPARLTIDACYANIDADLNQSVLLFSQFGLQQGGTPPAGFTFPSTVSSERRIRPRVIRALKARIALYRRDWDTAITEATAAIDNNGYAPGTDNTISLVSGNAAYANMFNQNEALGEVIFKIRFEQGEGGVGRNYWGESVTPGADICHFVSSSDLTGSYLGTDARFNSFFQATTNASNTLPGGGFAIAKHRGGSVDFGRADIKVFRLSEMYLIRAEAYERKNQRGNAQIELNAVRAARGVPAENIIAATPIVAISKILLEKRLELAYENHRLLELRRAGSGLRRTNHNVSGVTGAFERTANDPIFSVFPIPLAEMQVNPNMVQNPGY